MCPRACNAGIPPSNQRCFNLSLISFHVKKKITKGSDIILDSGVCLPFSQKPLGRLGSRLGFQPGGGEDEETVSADAAVGGGKLPPARSPLLGDSNPDGSLKHYFLAGYSIAGQALATRITFAEAAAGLQHARGKGLGPARINRVFRHCTATAVAVAFLEKDAAWPGKTARSPESSEAKVRCARRLSEQRPRAPWRCCSKKSRPCTCVRACVYI